MDLSNQTWSQQEQGLIRRISPTEDENEEPNWRTARSELGGNDRPLSPSLEPKNGSEYIQSIDTEGLVGMSSQVKQVIAMLRKQKPKGVVSIGIWGMVGIGKTTLARLIFKHIQSEFESTCFLLDVCKEWRMNGKVGFLRRLVSEICEEATDMRIDGIESVRVKLKERLCHKKVLLVVDDLNHLEQLHALCGSRDWFGKGSRIIITTRDRNVLEAFQVDDVYRMELLNDDESVQLFSRTAFQQTNPEGKLINLCRRVVTYADGLPLALKHLASFMNEQSIREWESAWMQLSIDLPPDIYHQLKLSFDSVDDDQKEIFLKLVLFYIGEDKNDVIQELNGHGCDADNAITVLVERSLITVDDDDKLRIHNLLQLMGRQVIRQSSQNKLLKRGQKYEVFLSFRGEDTRTTTTSYLYSALCNAGIVVFKDDVDLHRGNDINPELLQAIGSSKIAIIIFSKRYADSKWCLKELTAIMEFRKSNDIVVLPVFYHVEPSEICNQTSHVGEALEALKQRISPPADQVSTWKAALSKAGGIAGITVLGSWDESKDVEAIVKQACNILDTKYLHVAEHPVGVDDRVQEVITMLEKNKSEGVVMVGIWGMGGTGKSTIARAIYNKIGPKFEGRSYLERIREVWHQEMGRERLQDTLLSEICVTTQMRINSIESGKNTLRDRLPHKKVLVLLDDVDQSEQLEALVGSPCWFKPGSTIIITTRNQSLLPKMNCHVYTVKDLDERESLELFSWHAFKQESPKEHFTDLSRDIVEHVGRLPLALKVLGSYLFDREIEVWEEVLRKLKKFPDKEIQQELQRSYISLDDKQKEIFLDIACFFIGMDRNEVKHILEGCELYPITGIKTLEERSLVTIGEENKLSMHVLLRDMGREIIRRESEKEPGKRSRLWFHEDARAVLSKRKGKKAVEGLSFFGREGRSLNLPESEKMLFKTKSFKKMTNLRLLHLDNVQLEGDYKYISGDLRWLCWHGFPEKHIPSKFCQEELVAIELEHSSLIQVWEEPLLLENLKILNLSHSPSLVKTPDFSKLPNLEKLILKNCPKLSTIDGSIGGLHKLLLLDLEGCINLRSLPRSIRGLKCLETILPEGVMIEEVEEDIEQMESLTAPTMKQVPCSSMRLKSIEHQSFYYEQMEPSISEATNLIGTKHKCEEEEESQSIGTRKARKS